MFIYILYLHFPPLKARVGRYESMTASKRHLLNTMCSRQQDVGCDEGAAADESLVGLASDGQIPKQGAHIGPLAKLGGRGLPVIGDPRGDAVAIALSAPLEGLL